MPLPFDDNRNAVQTLHPVAGHILDLTMGAWTVTPDFVTDETLAVELQPEVDTVIMFGDQGPEIYIRANGYFIYDVRKFTKLKARPSPYGTNGRLYVNELG